MCLAIPGEVIDLHEREGLRFAKVRFAGVMREVCLEYEPEAKPGDFVLVHVGFAIGRIDPEKAAKVWEALEEIGETKDVLEEDDATLERIPGR